MIHLCLPRSRVRVAPLYRRRRIWENNTSPSRRLGPDMNLQTKTHVKRLARLKHSLSVRWWYSESLFFRGPAAETIWWTACPQAQGAVRHSAGARAGFAGGAGAGGGPSPAAAAGAAGWASAAPWGWRRPRPCGPSRWAARAPRSYTASPSPWCRTRWRAPRHWSSWDWSRGSRARWPWRARRSPRAGPQPPTGFLVRAHNRRPYASTRQRRIPGNRALRARGTPWANQRTRAEHLGGLQPIRMSRGTVEGGAKAVHLKTASPQKLLRKESRFPGDVDWHGLKRSRRLGARAEGSRGLSVCSFNLKAIKIEF